MWAAFVNCGMSQFSTTVTPELLRLARAISWCFCTFEADGTISTQPMFFFFPCVTADLKSVFRLRPLRCCIGAFALVLLAAQLGNKYQDFGGRHRGGYAGIRGHQRRGSSCFVNGTGRRGASIASSFAATAVAVPARTGTEDVLA